MILYVVELEMDVSLREEHTTWLNEHVREMRALPGFIGVEILTCIEPPPPDRRWVVCVQYRLQDRAAWQRYLAEHAPRMRQAALARFGDRVKTTRRVLETA